VVGINGTQEAIEAIEAGTVTVTYESSPLAAGEAAVAALEVAVADGGPRAEMPREVLVPWRRYDASNLDEYVPWHERTGVA
jgi:ABC-type sugar transport system substrate-binding protein